jgi:predicted PurR-regulated permease PerM
MLGFDVRAAKVVWTTALLLLLFYAIFLSSTTIVVVIFAIFFSYVIYPLVELLERRFPKRAPRVLSIAVVFALVIAVAGTAVILFGAQVEEEAISLSQKLPSQINAQDMANKIPLPGFIEPARQRISDFVRTQVAAGTDQAMPLAKRVGEGVMHVASNLIYVVLIPILSFLLIMQAPQMRRDFLSELDYSNKNLWRGIIYDLDELLSKYVRALLLLSIATLCAYGIAFWLLGVPYALLLAGLSALLEFVPFAGPLGAIVVTLIVALLSGHEHMLWLICFFFAYRMFQDYVISPLLMSKGVEVSPLLVIVGILAGDQLAGVVGIFLSVPVMAAVKIVATRLATARANEITPKLPEDLPAARATDAVTVAIVTGDTGHGPAARSDNR